MRVAVFVLLVAAACASAEEAPNGPQDKPGYEQTEAPDKQVEYVTGPNVGIVGPTVLGGKGQEVQPSGEELQSTDKEQRDISAQGAVYSGYQELPGGQDESKGQADAADAAYAKYAASLNYNGMKYVQSQDQQAQYRKPQKKPQIVKIGNRPTTQKVAYYQSEEPMRYTQNQDQHTAQLHAHINAHQLLSESPVRRPQEYQQSETHGQEERRGAESRAKSEASSSALQESQESQGEDGQQAAHSPNEASVYIPQEYLQYQQEYQLAQQEAQVGQLHFPGKHQLQLFLPQEASGRVNGHEPQQTAVQSPHLQAIQNGHQIQYIPTYISSQPETSQKERPSQHNPSLHIISQAHPQSVKQQPINPQPSIHRAQTHSQLQSPQHQSNSQPSHQPTSLYNNPNQYHLQQSNEALRRPQNVYVQTKQSTQSIQHAQKSHTTKPANFYHQAQSHPTIYRPKSPERLPQRQPEHLSLISHRQTHDKSPPHQAEQVYHQSESSQSTDDKLGPNPPLQSQVQPQYVQSQLQPHLYLPQTHYELSSDKVALRPLLYPIATPIGQPAQSQLPHQALQLIPTDAEKFYNVKIPNYIKALEQQSKPFGFAQMSYGKKPGSYSYSIFNKHS